MYTDLDSLSHNDIVDWLRRSMEGATPLPKMTPDESPSIAVFRLEKQLASATRESIRSACKQLIFTFCKTQAGEPEYIEELITLSALLKETEATAALCGLVQEAAKFEVLPLTVRQVVLKSLVDSTPPQSPDFWFSIANRSPDTYSSVALSGILSTDPISATKLFGHIPNDKKTGMATAVKLENCWDNLSPEHRFQFTAAIRKQAVNAKPEVAMQIAGWLNTKEHPQVGGVAPTLRNALASLLGSEAISPRVLTPKLWQPLAA